MTSRIRVLHVITGLGTGGAEKMLTKLVCAGDQDQTESIIVSLTDNGTLGQLIISCNVQVFSIGMRNGRVSLMGLLRLAKLIKQLKPNLIMGWMYHANIAALAAKFLSFKNIPLIWNIRHTPNNLSNEKKLLAILILLGAQLSFFPVRVIYNSYVSKIRHEKLGFRKYNSLVIANGFDTSIFKPSNQIKIQTRNDLGIPNNAQVLVHIARFHPMKDHKGFLHAASLVLKEFPDVWFVLIGRDVSFQNSLLASWIKLFDLGDRVLLLDERTDLANLLPSFDLLCLSSSWGEGFPNVIGEAMACGIPCVTTDVGDSAMIVGNAGYAVPPDDPIALADACSKLLNLNSKSRYEMGVMARSNIVGNYSLDAIVADYHLLYEQILK